jgi:uncharacterized glyoxalase superfamily protein PhnB
MQGRISLITLGVKNFKESLAFYERLGWEKSSASQENVAFFPLGGIVLSIYPYELLAEDACQKADGKGFGGITLAYNTKNEKEVDDTLMMAEKAGAKIIKPAGKVFWGGYSGYFADPDGYMWEVAYNPFWDFDSNDNLVLPI